MIQIIQRFITNKEKEILQNISVMDEEEKKLQSQVDDLRSVENFLGALNT